MFNSSVLDIAIGLVLVYLLISIVLTSVSEAIEALLKTRASDLEHALSELFQGDPAMLRSFYEHPLISGLYRGLYRRDAPGAAPAPDAAAAAANEVEPASTASEPVPQAEAPPPDAAGRGHGNLPAYIPREAFSAAVMDLLDSQGGQRLKQAVGALSARHGIDPAASRREIEGWYDGAMDRASGWFKRRTQFRLFVLGLAIAIIGNVNSVTIAQYLVANQEAREGLVQMAPDIQAGASQHGAARAPTTGAASDRTAANEAAANAATADANAVGDAVAASDGAGNAQTPGNEVATANGMQPVEGGASPSTDSERRNAWLRDQRGRLQAIGLPIGWSDPVVALMMSSFPARLSDTASNGERWASGARWAAALVILIAGYLATAFAVMLGAPFWFDLLGKLMVVRSTVKPRQKSPDEPPVDGAAPPAPPAPPAELPAAPPSTARRRRPRPAG
jgi:hypothetical protein